MGRNDVIRLVVAGGPGGTRRFRTDVPGNQRLRESYRAVPAGEENPNADAEATRVGMKHSRFDSPVAMAGVRGRKER